MRKREGSKERERKRRRKNMKESKLGELRIRGEKIKEEKEGIVEERIIL